VFIVAGDFGYYVSQKHLVLAVTDGSWLVVSSDTVMREYPSRSLTKVVW
jgi:hypothetical protein